MAKQGKGLLSNNTRSLASKHWNNMCLQIQTVFSMGDICRISVGIKKNIGLVTRKVSFVKYACGASITDKQQLDIWLELFSKLYYIQSAVKQPPGSLLTFLTRSIQPSNDQVTSRCYQSFSIWKITGPRWYST